MGHALDPIQSTAGGHSEKSTLYIDCFNEASSFSNFVYTELCYIFHKY